MFDDVGRINRDKSQQNYDRSQNARSKYMATLQASIDRAEKRRIEAEKAKREAELEAQKAAALARRDQKQALYEQQGNAQRGNIAAGAANADFQYRSRLNAQDQQGQLKRDANQAQFTSQRDRQQAMDQARRDERQFGYSTAENQQQFGQQLERDARQQDYSLQRDQLQQGNTLQRDAFQYGLDSRRQDQQQQHTLQRDAMQYGIQRDRDQRLNQFDTERDIRQNQFQGQRDNRQNMFDAQRDYRRQQFEQQNMFQRETADVAAKWQDQVQQLRASGMDFSPAQQKKMKDMDALFREKVLNGDLPEDLKQRAMLEHQKALSAIIPEQKISKPEDEIASQFFEHPSLGVLRRTVDRNGNPMWEPLNIGGGENQDAMIRQDAKEQEKKAAEMRKLTLDREKAMQNLIREVSTETNELGEKITRTPEEIDAEVLKRFAADEIFYVESGLPPHSMYQMKAQKEQEKQKPPAIQPKPQGVNPWAPQPGMGESLKSRSGDNMGTMPPVLLSMKPLTKDITERLSQFPGGNQIAKIREAHKSNSVPDQIMREATDTVIRAMMTGDTSDPHYAEAVSILEEAGLTLNAGK